VFVALGIQHGMRMRYIVICGLFGSTTFFHINGKIFEKKKVIEHKMFSDCFYNFRLKHFSFYEEFGEV